MQNQQDIQDIGDPTSMQKEEPQNQQKKDNSKIYFFVIAIVALLATNVYFYIKYKSSGEKLYTLAIQKQDLQIEIDRIEAELDNLSALKGNTVDGDLEESEQKARQIIETLRTKLDGQGISNEDLYDAKREVARLKGDVSTLKSTLGELKAKNEDLLKKNANLSEQVDITDKKVSSLSEENSTLKHKVTTASALKVSNIQVNGVSISKKGKIEAETKVRRVDKLQVLFSVADNILAQKGSKEIFVRVIDPEGNLYGDANNIFYVHGEKLQYTFKEAIQFSNNGEEYQFLWESDKFKKGAYTVLLYSDNAIMGRASVVLK